MKPFLYIVLLLLLLIESVPVRSDTAPTINESVRYTIAFGSCYDHKILNRPIWDAINKIKPELFIFMGDNAYIDSDDPAKFEQDYAAVFNNPGIKKLTSQSQILATWDDHDYGLQDGGKEFKAKQIAKQAFVRAFDYPEIRNIPEEQGIYHSRTINVGTKAVRVIMLDTRWYRDALLWNSLDAATRERFELGPYRPHLDESKTLLGKEQWQWLENTLKQPVDLNIIVSSIQFVSENTAWEIWANFPHERNHMLELLEKYTAGKVLFLSGDVHRGEFSALPVNDWILMDVTSSGLSAHLYPGKPNIHRLGKAYPEYNFGMLLIEDTGDKLTVKSGLFDNNGKVLEKHLVPLK